MLNNRGLSWGRRLGIFFLISGITIGLVICATSTTQTWDALRHIEIKDILLLGALCGLMFLFDALRTLVLCTAIGHRIPFTYALKMILVGMFFGAITPLQLGMLPAEIYMMYKYDIPLGNAISIDVIKRISTMGILAIAGVIVLVTNSTFASNKVLLYLYYYVIFFYLFVSFLFLGVYFFPKQTMWLVDKILGYLHKRLVIKDYEVDRYVHGVADDYFNTLDLYLHKGRLGFFVALVIGCLFITTQFILAPVIIHGLGFKVSFMDAIQAQIILLPMLYFSPTPGGSGVAEGGFALLFTSFIPTHLIGISVVLWRIFTTYIGVTLGVILTLGSINIDKVLHTSLTKR